MRITLIFIFIVIVSTLKAHYPVDVIQMIKYSELIVTGEVIENDIDDFKFRIRTVIKGKLDKRDIIISHKKIRETSYEENYNIYRAGQRIFLFLKTSVVSVDTVWSSVGNYDEAELKIQGDSIIFGSSVYTGKDKYPLVDFIEAISHFEKCFKIEYVYINGKRTVYSQRHRKIIIVKQVVCRNRIKKYNVSESHNMILETIKNRNNIHKWRRYKKWVRRYGGFWPYNGKYELLDYETNLIECKGKYKKGKHVKEECF